MLCAGAVQPQSTVAWTTISGSSMSFLLCTILSSSCAGLGFCPSPAWAADQRGPVRAAQELPALSPAPTCAQALGPPELQVQGRAAHQGHPRPGLLLAAAGGAVPSLPTGPPSGQLPLAHWMVLCRTWCMADTVFSQATCREGETLCPSHWLRPEPTSAAWRGVHTHLLLQAPHTVPRHGRPRPRPGVRLGNGGSLAGSPVGVLITGVWP